MRIIVSVFVIWIALQLMLLGDAAAQNYNALASGHPTICSKQFPEWVSTLIPLIIFVPSGSAYHCQEAK